MHDTLPKPERSDPGYTQEDWNEVSDTPSMTDAELAEMRPAQEVPEVFNLLPKRGRPKLADAKVNLTLRIDPAVLEAYKAKGPGWQVKMQEALAMHLLLEEVPTPNSSRRPGDHFYAHTKVSACGALETKQSNVTGQYIVHRPSANAAAPHRPKPKSA